MVKRLLLLILKGPAGTTLVEADLLLDAADAKSACMSSSLNQIPFHEELEDELVGRADLVVVLVVLRMWEPWLLRPGFRYHEKPISHLF